MLWRALTQPMAVKNANNRNCILFFDATLLFVIFCQFLWTRAKYNTPDLERTRSGRLTASEVAIFKRRSLGPEISSNIPSWIFLSFLMHKYAHWTYVSSSQKSPPSLPTNYLPERAALRQRFSNQQQWNSSITSSSPTMSPLRMTSQSSRMTALPLVVDA